MFLKEENMNEESRSFTNNETSPEELEKGKISEFLPVKMKAKKARKQMGSKKPCEYCGIVYGPYKMSLHVRVHTGDRPFKCDQCTKAFKQRGQLESHKVTHTNEKKYKCDYCEKVFGFPQARNRHLKLHEGALRLICGLCGSLCHSEEAMRKHKRRHEENAPVTCEICGKQFWAQYKYREHMEQAHVKKRFKCKLCSGVYSNRNSLKRHEAVHIQCEELQCEKCSFKTWYEKSMIRHKQQHLKGLLTNKFECTECNFVTYHKDMMRKHEKMHTLEFPILNCINCDFKTKDDRTLQGHIVRNHGGIKNFKCEQCELTFLTQMLKMTHEKRVHSETAYQCAGCFKYFSYSSGRKKHKCKKIYSGENVSSESDPLALNNEETSVVSVKEEICEEGAGKSGEDGIIEEVDA